jgi:uncharacterized protein (TIGR02453 family)
VSDHLPPAATRFLADLRAHNDKDWYARNRERCDAELTEPAKALVRILAAALGKRFPEITGSDKALGGSLTRLHRDVRFGKDKSPFHSHVGMHFWHRKGRKMEVPGFFLRVDPDEVLLGTGLHGPEPAPLEGIRKAIDRDPAGWKRAAHGPAFAKVWKGLEGEALQRVPKPWPADHPHAADLRRKEFTAFVRLPAARITKPGFVASAVDLWAASDDLMGFLCRATGLPW